MNFGSKKVYPYDHSAEEIVLEDSNSSFDAEDDSASSDEKRFRIGLAKIGRAVRNACAKVEKFFTRCKQPKKKDKAHLAGSRYQSNSMPQPRLSSDGISSPSQYQSDCGPPPKAPVAPAAPKHRKKIRKADPNLFTVGVGEHVIPKEPVVGKKILECRNCKGVATAFSKFQVKEGINNWLCDFCRSYNREVDVVGWTKPETDDITYELLAPPTEGKEQKMEEPHNVVFVIDISGSMGSTMENDIVTSSGTRTRTFVSRLEAVIKAAEHQIRQIREESPNVGVGLISFGSEVTVYGDGTTVPKTLRENEMASEDVLKAVVSDLPPLRPISETFDALTHKLVDLDIRGCTALGPGLLSGISLASNISGSKVIICTDGCANQGFGELPNDNCQDEEDISRSRMVYKSFGDYAKSRSVTVSVISLEGTDCRLVHLGLVAQITGGFVEIVDPRNIATQFGNILASKVVATDVTVSIILDHSLYIRDLQTTEQKSTQVKEMGNVSADTEIVVEFGVRTLSNENEQLMTIDAEDQQANDSGEDNATAAGSTGDAGPTSAGSQEGENVTVAPAAASEPDEAESNITAEPVAEVTADHAASLPFQAQLEFTTRSGGKYRRVISNLRETTDDRATAEAEMNMNIVASAPSNMVSNAALSGDVQQARGFIQTKKKMARRYQVGSAYIRDLQTVDQRSTQVKQMGNVSADTEMVVELGVRTLSNENHSPKLAHPELSLHQTRMVTFDRSSTRHPVSAEKLSRAGLFSEGEGDLVKCFCCGGKLEGWRKEDDPWIGHAKWYPGCTFVQLKKGIPFIIGARQQMTPDQITQSNSLDYNKGDVTFLDASQNAPALGLRRRNDLMHVSRVSPGIENLGAGRGKVFEVSENRRGTYPQDANDAVADLWCTAGFLYISQGNDDRVQCFWCKGTLSGWQQKDDPRRYHAMFFPGCTWLQMQPETPLGYIKTVRAEMTDAEFEAAQGQDYISGDTAFLDEIDPPVDQEPPLAAAPLNPVHPPATPKLRP